jgi:amidase
VRGGQVDERVHPGDGDRHDLYDAAVDDMAEISAAQLQHALSAGACSAVELLDECLARITAGNGRIAAVGRTDPTAREHAATSDQRRAESGTARPLEGIPVLIKDNIAVTGMPTTAGSRALASSSPPDAALVTRLRAAGAVIVGKANLSEWANFRSTHSTSGWSALGGQVRNPYVLECNPSGSSSGSAAAVAAGFVPLAVGTETDGSIVSPAGCCGVVGYKPAVGAAPTTGIVPVSCAQDTAGPIARTVADAALLAAVLSGTPPARLAVDALRGARIGIWRPAGADPVAGVFDASVDAIRGAGAQTVEVAIDAASVGEDEMPAMIAEFRAGIDAYLAHTPGAEVRSLAELVEFNRADDVELSRFGQELFELALDAPPLSAPEHRERRARATRTARGLIDDPLRGHRLDEIVAPTNGPAWRIDYGTGDVVGTSSSCPAAVAGYPSITVPAGHVGPLPVGLSFIAPTSSTVFDLAFAFERATRARRRPNTRSARGAASWRTQ